MATKCLGGSRVPDSVDRVGRIRRFNDGAFEDRNDGQRIDLDAERDVVGKSKSTQIFAVIGRADASEEILAIGAIESI